MFICLKSWKMHFFSLKEKKNEKKFGGYKKSAYLCTRYSEMRHFEHP